MASFNLDRFVAGLYGKDAVDKFDRNRSLGNSGNAEFQNLDAATIRELARKKENQRKAREAAELADQKKREAARKAVVRTQNAEYLNVPESVLEGGLYGESNTRRRDFEANEDRDRASFLRQQGDTRRASGNAAGLGIQGIDVNAPGNENLQFADSPVLSGVIRGGANDGGASAAQLAADDAASLDFYTRRDFTQQAGRDAISQGISYKEVLELNKNSEERTIDINQSRLNLDILGDIAQGYVANGVKDGTIPPEFYELAGKPFIEYTDSQTARIVRKIEDKNPSVLQGVKGINTSTTIHGLSADIAKLRARAAREPRALPFPRVDPNAQQPDAQAPPATDDFSIRRQFGEGAPPQNPALQAADAAAFQRGLPQQGAVQPEVAQNEAQAAAAAVSEPPLPLPQDSRSFRPEFEQNEAQAAAEAAAPQSDFPQDPSDLPSQYESPAAHQIRTLIDQVAPEPIVAPGTDGRTPAQRFSEILSANDRRPRDHNAVRARRRPDGGEASPSSFTARGRGARAAEPPVPTEAQNAAENLSEPRSSIAEAFDPGGGKAYNPDLGFREGVSTGRESGNIRADVNIEQGHQFYKGITDKKESLTGHNRDVFGRGVETIMLLLEKESKDEGGGFAYETGRIVGELPSGIKEQIFSPFTASAAQISIEGTARRIMKLNEGRRGAGLPPLNREEMETLFPSDNELAAIILGSAGLELASVGTGVGGAKAVSKKILKSIAGGAVGAGTYSGGEAGATAALAGDDPADVAKQAAFATAIGAGVGGGIGGTGDVAARAIGRALRRRGGKGDNSPRVEPRTRAQTEANNEKRTRDAEQSESQRAADDAAAAAEQKAQDDLASGYDKQKEGKPKNVYEDEPLENRLKDEPEEGKPSEPEPTPAQVAAAAAAPPTPETIAQAAASAVDPANTPPKKPRKPAVVAPPPPKVEETPAQVAAAAAAPEAAPKPPKKPRKAAVVAPPPPKPETPAQVAAAAAAPPKPPKAKPLTPAQKKRQAEVRRLEREAEKAEPLQTPAQIAADKAAGAPREAAAVPDGAPTAPVAGAKPKPPRVAKIQTAPPRRSTTQTKAEKFLKKAQSTRQATYEGAVAAVRALTRKPQEGKREDFNQAIKTKGGKRQVGFKYAIIHADSLITSDQKEYGAFSKLQNRGEVGKVVNQDIVSEISGSNFEAGRIASRDNNLQTGAPIVYDIGNGRFIVLAGNHRTAAVRHILEQGPKSINGEAYATALEKAGFGRLFNEGNEGAPVIVRVIDDDLDAGELKALSDLANEAQIAAQRPVSASTDIGERILAAVRERREDKNSGSGIERDLNNADGRKAFLEAVGPAEAQRYRGEGGGLNNEGENRFRSVLVSIALGDRDDRLVAELMNIVAGEVDDKIKGPINAIADSAGSIAGLKEAVDGELVADTFDLSAALRQVAFDINQARKDGTSPQDFYTNEKALKTGSAQAKDGSTTQSLGFTEEPFAMQDALWKVFFKENKDGTLGRARSAQNGSSILKEYVEAVFDDPNSYNPNKKGAQPTLGDDFDIEQFGADMLQTITRKRDKIDGGLLLDGDDPPNPR